MRALPAEYVHDMDVSLRQRVAGDMAHRRDAVSGVISALVSSGSFADVLSAASSQTLGYWWQDLDLAFWEAQGASSSDFKNRPGPDGCVNGTFLQLKAARVSPYGRFSFSGLAPYGSDVVNVALCADPSVDPAGWHLVTGTSVQMQGMKASARAACSKGAAHGALPGFAHGEKTSLLLSRQELSFALANFSGVMLLGDYVASWSW